MTNEADVCERKERHPKRFVNSQDMLVQEAIDGFLVQHPQILTRIDAFPHTKVFFNLYFWPPYDHVADYFWRSSCLGG